jgi:dolichol-phosphate mannosyltransferase
VEKLLTPPTLSVVIPTRNEAASAPELVSQLADILSGTSSEVIFVDDSDDNTARVLRESSVARRLTIQLIERRGTERRGGLSTAVVQGIRSAGGRYVLIMDADLQHPTELIPVLLNTAEEGDADLVIASRNVPGGSDEGLDSTSRRMISWGARWLVKLLFFRTLRRVTDPLSGFFVARRDVLIDAALRPIGFKILLDILVRCDLSKVEEVPLPFARRAGGASKATFGQGKDFLAHVLTLFWDRWTDVDLRRRRGILKGQKRA